MRYYVGVTDYKWFSFLAARQPDEVNFWRPGGAQSFRAVQTGAPFLFKLHAPYNCIAGGGFFLQHQKLPLSLAWKCFGESNGAQNLDDVRKLIQNRRRDCDPNPHIGCTILTRPFFLPEDQWIPTPPNWSRNIVQGKTYDTEEQAGALLWAQVQERLQGQITPDEMELMETEPGGLRWREAIVKRRLGQGTFRLFVTNAYHARCAITGEKTLPVLEAAHIKPYAEHGPHKINNGLLLRSDLHDLFDAGYLTVTPDMHVEVSPRIHEEWHNGKEYYRFHGNFLRNRPDQKIDTPSREFLEWHNENRYIA